MNIQNSITHAVNQEATSKVEFRFHRMTIWVAILLRMCIQVLFKVLIQYPVYAYAACVCELKAMLNLCVFMHICECVYLPLSVICQGDRGSQHDPQWADWDLDYSLLLPVRGVLLSSERRQPQLWGFAHKPVYSDL